MNIIPTLKIIHDNTRPKRGWEIRLSKIKEDKLFLGHIAENNFQIQRITQGKNSFKPQMDGTLVERTGSTEVTLDLKLNLFVLIFMLFWLGGVSIAVIGSIYGILYMDLAPFSAIIPSVMLLFGLGMVYFGFTMEKEKCIQILTKLLQLRQTTSKFRFTKI